MVQRFNRAFNPTSTPQSERIPGRPEMVQNSAGGYAFAVDDWKRLERFLIIGTEGGTYYATQRDITKESCEVVLRLIKKDGVGVVNKIVEISDAGRAYKNDPAIFVLALCFANGDTAAKIAARKALPKICRIGTHLFHFLMYVDNLRGWGKCLRKGVRNWYNSMPVSKLELQAVKYRQRDGWSHRDALRLAHPQNEERNYIYRFMTRHDGNPFETTDADGLLYIFDQVQRETNKRVIIQLILEYNLPREVLPTQWLNDPDIWGALLNNMPLMAMVRNLGNMSKVGLLKPFDESVNRVIGMLENDEMIAKSRIHPIHILTALMVYAAGHSARGKGEWTPVPQVIDALDGAFYKAFKNIEPTGKNWLIGLDVSGSMDSDELMGIPGFTPRMASAAMAMATIRAESQYITLGFTGQLVDLALSSKQRLDDVIRTVSGLPFGRTDCALPMLVATHNKLDVDVFAIYTDNETWFGNVHPCQALQEYRNKSGRNAKLVVVGATSSGFTIADPDDAGTLDVVGFDSATPQVIADFARG